jgi:hypothetical protein
MDGCELGLQVFLVFGDLFGAAGELGHELFRHAGDLIPGPVTVPPGTAVPADPERGGEQVFQDPLVHLGQGDRRLEQGPGIQGPPLAVGGGAGAVPHHHVVVQLGVVGAGGPVGERGGHRPGDVFFDDAVGA